MGNLDYDKIMKYLQTDECAGIRKHLCLHCNVSFLYDSFGGKFPIRRGETTLLTVQDKVAKLKENPEYRFPLFQSKINPPKRSARLFSRFINSKK